MSPNYSRETVLAYHDWNHALWRQVFSARNAHQPIRFAVDPLVLQRAAAEGTLRHHFPTPEAAAEDFILAVRRQIDSTHWRLGDIKRDQLPLGLAKLGLQVLAVFYISQDDVDGGGYWAALWKLLGRPVERTGVMPVDLDAYTHQDNWLRLTKWANILNGRRQGYLPEPDDLHGYVHVKLPLGHGLLRQQDIEQLSRFFRLADMSAGEEVEPEELMPYIRAFATDSTVFRGVHARRVLADERLPLAAAQIANALVQWDGQIVDLRRSRSPVYRLWLATHGQNPFRLRGGLKKIDPNGQEMDIPGADLDRVLRRGTLSVSYRPINEGLILAVRSLLDGRYQETRQARPGDEIVLLRRLSPKDDRFATQLMPLTANQRVDRATGQEQGVPVGWTAFRLRLRESLQEGKIPGELRDRLRVEGIRMRVVGGLRVRRGWISGAGPTVEVIGKNAEAVAAVIVDGVEYDLSAGRLSPESCPSLSQVGPHEVWLPGRHRERVRFRVLEPTLARFRSPVVTTGWQFASAAWPTLIHTNEEVSRGTIRGPVIEGDWPPIQPPALPLTQFALQLALLARGVRTAELLSKRQRLREAAAGHPNLLIRQLGQGVPPVG